MKYFIQKAVTIAIPILLFVNPILGQEQKKLPADIVQKTVLLDEVKAILANDNNAVTVKAILGNKTQTELNRGDTIFMAQGEPVSSVADLMKLYEKTNKNGEFKMAVKRGDERFLTSFDIDPSSSTGREMVTGTMKFNSYGSNTGAGANADIVPELLVYGIMAAGSDNGLIIKKTMPNLDSGLKEKGISDGDIIISVDGRAVNSHKEFKEAWDAISEGKKVELKIRKGDQNVSVFLSKKDVNGKIIFQKEGEK